MINIRLAVNRHFGETNMNARSSRSHTIFRMVWFELLHIRLSLDLCYSNILLNLINQVIESKGKDTNSFCDNSSVDAIRVSVLVCIPSLVLYHPYKTIVLRCSVHSVC